MQPRCPSPAEQPTSRTTPTAFPCPERRGLQPAGDGRGRRVDGLRVATWGSPHRTALAVLIVFGAAWALAPLLAGVERVVRSAHREALFLSWSLGSVAFIAALAVLDGGARSPLALMFFLPLAFAALSYPMPSVVVIGTVDVLASAVVGLTDGSTSQAYLALFATCLAVTALLCAWAALDHDRQRDALARVSRADPLTGCLNRRGFEERFEAELSRAARDRAPARPGDARPRPLQGDQRHARPRRRRRAAALGGRRR